MIYVTHDQTEAMTLGTKIVVMKDGVIQQVDTPQNLYNHPQNKFVAGFIGSPQMNFLDGVVEKRDNNVFIKIGNQELMLNEEKGNRLIENGYVGKEITIGIRPEHVYNCTDKENDDNENYIEATINVYELLGSEVYLHFNVEGFSMVAVDDAETKSRVGDNVKFRFDMQKIHIFDKESELVIESNKELVMTK
jgi:multiple sugar transport system ATP-binding protein